LLVKLIDQIWGLPRARSGGWHGWSALGAAVCFATAIPNARAQTPAAGMAATASAGGAVVLEPAVPPTGPASAAAPARAPGSVAPSAAAATRPSPLNPTPAEFPKTNPAPSTSELDGLLARVAALRSRIDALSNAMFSSRLRVEVRAGGDTVRLEALHVSLDGGVVYTAPPRAVFDRPEVVFEHAVAPGAHVVAIEVERHDAQNPQFSTWQESRFVVLVPEKKLLWTRLELEDESSMAEDFHDDHAGKYLLSVKLQAEVNE
jgi:hypothetical protein